MPGLRSFAPPDSRGRLSPRSAAQSLNELRPVHFARGFAG